jgi:hypothetical protein
MASPRRRIETDVSCPVSGLAAQPSISNSAHTGLSPLYIGHEDVCFLPWQIDETNV